MLFALVTPGVEVDSECDVRGRLGPVSGERCADRVQYRGFAAAPFAEYADDEGLALYAVLWDTAKVVANPLDRTRDVRRNSVGRRCSRRGHRVPPGRRPAFSTVTCAASNGESNKSF